MILNDWFMNLDLLEYVYRMCIYVYRILYDLKGLKLYGAVSFVTCLVIIYIKYN